MAEKLADAIPLKVRFNPPRTVATGTTLKSVFSIALPFDVELEHLSSAHRPRDDRGTIAMPIEQSRDPKQFSDFELSGRDNNISGYDAAFGAVARQSVRPMLDAARVTRGMRVLDACCGPAMLAAGALERGAEAVGLDFSLEAVELARRLVPKGSFERGDVQALPFPAGSFDAVLCGYGLMHLPDPGGGGWCALLYCRLSEPLSIACRRIGRTDAGNHR